MISWLKSRRARQRTARLLYGSIVSAARRPEFYANWGVPDTIQGRFEMIILHIALAVRRLESEGDAGRLAAQALMEAFVVDMDDEMRELTFGDLAVPREIKRATAAVFDRHNAYFAALDGPRNDLRRAVADQLTYLESSGLDAGGLADYVVRASEKLSRQQGAQILTGQIEWPEAISGQRTS
jgi:cytochrome b pre-mRNA-processing protein 3